MNTNLFIFASIISALLLLGCAQTATQPSPEKLAPPSRELFTTIATGSTNQGDVLIELTPKRVTSDRIDVAFAATTHSVDLSQFNLLDITSLELNGATITALSAPTMKGHHASGIISFDVQEEPTTFTITILTIPQQQKRIYSWSEQYVQNEVKP